MPGDLDFNHSVYYFLFKQGITPDDHNVHNRDGGKWVAVVPQGYSPDWYWIELQMMSICKERKCVNGCAIRGKVEKNREKKFQVELWVTDLRSDAVMEIGEEMRDCLCAPVKLLSHRKKENFTYVKQLRYPSDDRD